MYIVLGISTEVISPKFCAFFFFFFFQKTTLIETAGSQDSSFKLPTVNTRVITFYDSYTPVQCNEIEEGFG